MKQVFLFLADGFEEIEALSTVDVLRRGEIDVKTISITDRREVSGAHGITVIADSCLHDVLTDEAEMLIFPGGMPGAKHLAECKPLIEKLTNHFERGGLVAAICAAPALVLSCLPLKPDMCLTCYPGFESYLPHVNVTGRGLVTDGNLITAKGPAFACAFGLAIVERIQGKAKAGEVVAGMLYE